MFNINFNVNDDNLNDIYLYLALYFRKEPPIILNFQMNNYIINKLEKFDYFYYSSNIRGYKIRIDNIDFFLVYYIKTNKITLYIKEEIYIKYKDKILNFIKKINKNEVKENKIEINLVNLKNQNLNIVKKYISLKELKRNFKLKYFKFLNVEPKLLAKKFFNSNENILILTGIPGVGKTKLISTLIYYTNLFFKDNVVFFYIKGIDSLFNFLKEYAINNIDSSKIIYLILDDFDYLKDFNRKVHIDTIEKELISLILSLSDGILKHRTKFIISSNIQIKNIDEALLRTGRLFKLLKLTKININEIYNKYNSLLNKKERKIIENLIKQNVNEILISDLIKKIKE